MWKFIANLLLAALAIGLTFFTASRTLDLLAQWLPANQQIMQWLGLAAFEGGLYFWAFYFVTAAKGAAQRGIAGIMVVACFVSVAVATVADLLLVGAESGKLPSIPADQKQAIVVFVGVVIVLNVAAFLGAKLTHPDKLKEMAVQDAEDQIGAMELRLIRKIAPSVAMQMAPIKAEQWVNDTWAQMLPGTGRPVGMIESSVQYQSDSTPPPTTPTPAGSAPQKKRGWRQRAGAFIAGSQEAPIQQQIESPESSPLYREEQRTRRAAPSAGLPLVPDEETALRNQQTSGNETSEPAICFYCEEEPSVTLRRDPVDGLVPIGRNCMQKISAPLVVSKPKSGESASPLAQNGHQK
jgi:hypothetical protein